MKCWSIHERSKVTQGHLEACKNRIREAMKQDGNTGDVDKAEERKMRYYERELEQADREAKRARRDGDPPCAGEAESSGAATA